MKRKVILLGAAGRDFHNFNMFFRGNPNYEVVCFTATQIPFITGRKYPPELSGPLYPKGVPIFDERDLPKLIKKFDVELVVFSYSDVSNQYVMERAAIAMANGASYMLLGPKDTMLKSNKPVISVCAVRTGSGKSPTTRKIGKYLLSKGIKVAVIRHPMPYGNLSEQIMEKFETVDDLDRYKCTVEEREDYEHLIKAGLPVYAGVDYEKILRTAEKDAEIIIWDGGNNDYPFIKPDLSIVVTDPHRAGHELTYYPGNVNFLMADVIIINKVDTAEKEKIELLRKHIKQFNPRAMVIETTCPVTTNKPELIKNKRVVVVEDGPTVTHGGMKIGAGYLAAEKYGAKEIVDPRPFAVGTIKETYKKYPHLEKVLPAMGYSKKQINELEQTLNKADCDTVVTGTPIDLSLIIKINKPIVHVVYGIKEVREGELTRVIDEFLDKKQIRK